MDSSYDYDAAFASDSSRPSQHHQETQLAFQGTVVYRFIKNRKVGLRITEETMHELPTSAQKPNRVVTVWLPRDAPVPPLYAQVQVVNVFQLYGDSPDLNCKEVHDLGACPPLASEHVPLPIPAGSKGVPFLVRVAQDGVTFFRQSPGTRCKVDRDMTDTTWVRQTTGATERRLTFRGTLSQWNTPEELRNQTYYTLAFKFVVWDDKCRTLRLSADMEVWRRLMAVHAFPFTAALCTDTTNPRFASLREVSLHVLSVAWDVATYLRSSPRALPLTQKEAAALLPLTLTAQNDDDDDEGEGEEVFNASARHCMPPTTATWSYYALSSNPAATSTAAALKAALANKTEVAVLLAVRTLDVHSDEDSAPLELVDDDDEEEEKEEEEKSRPAKRKLSKMDKQKKPLKK